MEEVVVGDVGCEPAIKNLRHYLPYHFHKANTIFIPLTLGYQDHRLLRDLFRQMSLPEILPNQVHHVLPVCHLLLCLGIRLLLQFFLLPPWSYGRLRRLLHRFRCCSLCIQRLLYLPL